MDEYQQQQVLEGVYILFDRSSLTPTEKIAVINMARASIERVELEKLES